MADVDRTMVWVVSTSSVGNRIVRDEAGPFATLAEARSAMRRLGATGHYRDDFGGIPLAVAPGDVAASLQGPQRADAPDRWHTALVGDQERESAMGEGFGFTVEDDVVRYYPWTNGYAVGFRAAFRDGRPDELIYLVPTQSTAIEPDVTLYAGHAGAPADDTALCWHGIGRPEHVMIGQPGEVS